jgi:hypothetical protein
VGAHGARLIHRNASRAHSHAHHQAVTRLKGKNAASRYTVHLQQRSMRGSAMMQPGMHDAVVKGSIGKTQRLGVLKTPRVGSKLIAAHAIVQIRDRNRGVSLFQQRIAVKLSTAYNQDTLIPWNPCFAKDL